MQTSWAKFLTGFVLWGVAASGRAAPAAPPTPARLEYNRDIRPILSDTCFLCHGPDRNTRKGKLRLDQREEAVTRKALVPGHPEESSLMTRILSSDPEEVMPPPDSHRTLSATQKELLRRWVREGAEYQPHWAYVKPVRPEVPKVRRTAWLRNPIDAFILQNLEAHHAAPSKEADRRTLLRRLSLDLTGLPPAPEELARFESAREPLAYEKEVDRLLQSPHFGERMAVPWLDCVRFSDTVGYHGDQNQRIFPYRDYVIGSFNRNKRFDAFTVEQLAGDLLPEATVEQRVATGFNRLNMMTREGGAQPKEYLAKYAADRVRTVAATWLGSTMGCAECHDHKFDPFTMRDFYSLGAFFADVEQWGVYSDYKYTPNPDLKGWSNDHPFPPELEVQSDYLKARSAHLRGRVAELWSRLADRWETNAAIAAWAKASLVFVARQPSGWEPLDVIPLPPPPPVITTITNVSASSTNVVTRTNPPPAPILIRESQGAWRVALGGKTEEVKIECRVPVGTWAALRLERLSGEAEESVGPGEQLRGVRFSAALKHDGKEIKLAFHRADADRKEPRYASGQEIIGVLGGWLPSTAHPQEMQTAVWQAQPVLRIEQGDVLLVSLRSAGPMTIRLAASPFAAEDPLASGMTESFHAALAAFPARLSSAQRDELAQRYLLSTQADETVFKEFKRLEQELLECREGRVHTMVTVERSPAVTRVLPRGNWQNESGEIVSPATPHFLPAPPGSERRRLTRLDLARWLVSEDNPLTARVVVNRLWKQFFGTALSAVVDDIGAQGEWPLHAALLDWLAVEFRRPESDASSLSRGNASSGGPGAGPWDIQHMVRLIVTSAAYRQSSNQRREWLEQDPQNRWLAGQNPRRLEAEFVRDNALAAAGLLNLDLGGPSARPYQPAGYYEALQFPDREYVASLEERQYRRGVYTHWQRTFLHPMLANFDAPAREECTASRNVSNTPQQALTLLNDPTFVEAARAMAVRLLQGDADSDRRRLQQAWERALGRRPAGKELSSLVSFLAGQRAHYQANIDEANQLVQVGVAPAPASLHAVELAAWTQVCRVILNTHESITRY